MEIVARGNLGESTVFIIECHPMMCKALSNTISVETDLKVVEPTQWVQKLQLGYSIEYHPAGL
jgi:hypothetical protein